MDRTEQLKALIEKDISQILGDLEDGLASTIAQSLINKGLGSQQDLALVTEKELPDLNVFQARKLLLQWQAKPGTSNQKGTTEHVPLGNALRHSSYQVRWEMMPHKIFKKIQSKKALSNREINTVVAHIIDDMLFTVPNMSRSMLPDVSQDVIKQHPESFADIMIDGGKTGEKMVTKQDRLLYKLRNRLDNESRQERSKQQMENPNIPASVGCVRWRVLDLPEDESSIQQKADDLKEIFHNQRRRDWDWTDIEEKMNTTYAFERRDLNTQFEKKKKKRSRKRKQSNKENEQTQQETEDQVDDPDDEQEIVSTDMIENRYPFLFHPRGMAHHFQILTKIDFADNLKRWIEEMDLTLIDYLAHERESNLPIRASLTRAIRRGEIKEKDLKLMAMLEMLMGYFEEDFTTLFLLVEPGTRITDVQNQHDVPGTAHLYGVGNKLFSCEKFYFSLDGKVRASAASFRSAVLMYFCSYFVFNLQYPDHSAKTLDFIQRYIAKINPPKGSRVSRKVRGPNSIPFAVSRLVNEYKVYLERINPEDSE